jgi:hypothetical protein
MFISMKTCKILCYNGKSDGKRGDPSVFKILRLLRFARNDNENYTLDTTGGVHT